MSATNIKGYIVCDHKHCNEIAEVRQATGKRSSLYTVCPKCKANQSSGEDRQRYLLANLKVNRLDLEAVIKASEKIMVPMCEESAKPSNHAVYSKKDDTDTIPKETEIKPTPKPEKASNPPLILAVIAVFFTLIGGVITVMSKRKEQATNV